MNISQKIVSSKTLKELEKVRVELFGKSGYFPLEFAKLKTIKNEDKKEFANKINKEKAQAEKLFLSQKEKIENILLQEELQRDKIDESLFSHINSSGAMHPVYSTLNEIIDFFTSMNFQIENGPLVEDDFHNFEALNLPKHHPAREMQDTFYFKDEKLLRTHTSPVQIRSMLKQKPPFKLIAPGAVFRRDMT